MEVSRWEPHRRFEGECFSQRWGHQQHLGDDFYKQFGKSFLPLPSFLYLNVYICFSIKKPCCCQTTIPDIVDLDAPETALVGSRSDHHRSTTPKIVDESMGWFHGKITREEAEALLMPREVCGFVFLPKSCSFIDFLTCIGWIVSGARKYKLPWRLCLVRVIQCPCGTLSCNIQRQEAYDRRGGVLRYSLATSGREYLLSMIGLLDVYSTPVFSARSIIVWTPMVCAPNSKHRSPIISQIITMCLTWLPCSTRRRSRPPAG